MWPSLVSIGPITIHSFGLLVALGVFFGGFVLWQKGREEGFEETEVMDSWLLSGVMAVVIGRLWYVLDHWQNFSGSWYRMLFITKFPGLSYEGVWLGAILTLIVICLKKQWSVWKYGEITVFAWLMTEIFGWLGAFLAGSNLGKATSWWWGLGFPGVNDKRHPVQILYLVLLLVLFRLLTKWEKEYRSFSWYQNEKNEPKPGFLVATYLIGLGLIRLLLGFLSALEIGWMGLAVSQWLAITIVIIGGLILLERSGIKMELAKKQEAVKKNGRFEAKKIKVIQEKKQRKKKGFDFK